MSTLTISIIALVAVVIGAVVVFNLWQSIGARRAAARAAGREATLQDAAAARERGRDRQGAGARRWQSADRNAWAGPRREPTLGAEAGAAAFAARGAADFDPDGAGGDPASGGEPYDRYREEFLGTDRDAPAAAAADRGRAGDPDDPRRAAAGRGQRADAGTGGFDDTRPLRAVSSDDDFADEFTGPAPAHGDGPRHAGGREPAFGEAPVSLRGERATGVAPAASAVSAAAAVSAASAAAAGAGPAAVPAGAEADAGTASAPAAQFDGAEPAVAADGADADRDAAATSPAELPQAVVEHVVVLAPPAPVNAERLIALTSSLRHVGSKAIRIEVDTGGRRWEPLKSGLRVHRVRCSLLLANRLGPLNAIELSDFDAAMESLAEQLQAPYRAADMNDVLRAARELDAAAARLDTQVDLGVELGEPLTAQRLAAIARQLDLYDRGGGRHARFADHGELLYTMTAGASPDLVAFVLDVPRTVQPQAAWRGMVASASACAQALGGRVIDSAGRGMSVGMIDAVDRQIRKRTDELASAGLPAGSPAAMRVFN
ncbi:MAG: hypothetical protein AB7G13_20450 [Lautropia sp.]